MLVQEKLDAVLKVLDEHNFVVGENSQGYIFKEKFKSYIKAMGGTTEERLKNLSYEDILACLMDAGVFDASKSIKPTPLAKDIAKIFRGNVDLNEDKKYISSKKVDRLTLRELVEAYLPEESDNAVGKRLSSVSKGNRFIVYNDVNATDVETTLKLLTEVKDGYPSRKSIEVKGIMKYVYNVGEMPDKYVDENPLYPTRPLRPDGTCDQTGRSWDGVSLEARQLIYIIIKSNCIKLDLDKANDLMDIVMGANPLEKLKSRYREAALEFEELKKTNNLPKLRVLLSPKKFKNNELFNTGKRVDFGQTPLN